MNQMIKKLIQDGSEKRKNRINCISTRIGQGVLIMGILCMIIKTLSPESVDETGLLHENFILLPSGFLLIFCGGMILLSTKIIAHGQGDIKND